MATLYTKIRDGITVLSHTLYPKGTLDGHSQSNNVPSVTQTIIIQQPSFYDRLLWYTWYPQPVTHVHVYPENAKKEEKKEKKERDDSLFLLGCLLMGGIMMIATYVFSVDYIERHQVNKVDKKVRKLSSKITSDTLVAKPYRSEDLLRVAYAWRRWVTSYRSTRRLSLGGKVALVASGGLIACEMMQKIPVRFGWWALMASTCYYIGTTTLYYGLWKKKEEKLMDKVVMENNAASLLEPSVSPTYQPQQPSAPSHEIGVRII